MELAHERIGQTYLEGPGGLLGIDPRNNSEFGAMGKVVSRQEGRKRRHRRIRNRVVGTSSRPRLCVFRSLMHIYVQIIDDGTGQTLVAASSRESELSDPDMAMGANVKGAKAIGRLLGQRAVAAGIKEVVFDRSGYRYHGRIKALAEAARGQGLQF